MKLIKLLAVSALVLYSQLNTASAVEVVTSVGYTQFHSAPNGIWYQKGFPYELKLASPSYGIEVLSDRNGPWQFGIQYMDVGKVSSRSEAVKDTEYNLQDYTCRGNCTLVTYIGKGQVRTLSGVLRRYYGDFFLEGALQVTDTAWEVDMPNWTDDTQPRFHLHIQHNRKLKYYPAVAAGYRAEHVQVKCSLIPAAATGDDWPAVYRGVQANCGLGYVW